MVYLVKYQNINFPSRKKVQGIMAVAIVPFVLFIIINLKIFVNFLTQKS